MTDRVEITALAERDLDALCAALGEAFADYFVPHTGGRDATLELLRLRGASLEDSVAARAGGRIVGFVVNALADGRAYNVVTGVVPRHRRGGVASRLIRSSVEHVAERGCREYTLEVLRQNEAALRLYAGAGFTRTRELAGLRLDGVPPARPQREATWVAAEPEHVVAAGEDLGYAPSWQNEPRRLSRHLDAFRGLSALVVGERVATGLVHPRSGSVPLLAVRADRRGTGLGRALLAELMSRHGTTTASFVNLVRGPGDAGIAWLRSLGAEERWVQHEMRLRPAAGEPASSG